MEMEVELDINNEMDKLNKIINNKEIPPFENYSANYEFLNSTFGLKYLLYVLELTYDHPEIEIYLKQLLENYNVLELNNLGAYSFTILHCMMNKHKNISLNSFEMIINFGISVNSQTKNKDTPLHFLCYVLCYELLEHEQNIINLFVKYGVDLNILGYCDRTVLDEVAINYLNKHLKIIIMTLIDFGAKINNPYEFANVYVLEFIELYRSNNIKLAIKK